MRRQAALQSDRHVAQAQGPVPGVEQGLGHDPDRVGEVDDPGTRRTTAGDELGQLEDDRHGPQCLGKSTGPDGLLANDPVTRRDRLVAQPRRLPTDPQLEQDVVGPVNRLVAVRGEDEPARPAEPLQHPSTEAADDIEPLLVQVEEHQLVDLEPIRAAGETVDQFRGVGAATADDGDLHAHLICLLREAPPHVRRIIALDADGADCL